MSQRYVILQAPWTANCFPVSKYSVILTDDAGGSETRETPTAEVREVTFTSAIGRNLTVTVQAQYSDTQNINAKVSDALSLILPPQGKIIHHYKT